jgi:predicted transcriptional regulator
MKVLLSIKPEHAERIFNGSKRFEFRKAIFKNDEVKTVVVYATMPVGRVIGEFTVGEIIENRPSEVWRKTKNYSGITRNFFDEYFTGRAKAFAIEVHNPRLYKKSLNLADVHPSGVAPQSFCYL